MVFRNAKAFPITFLLRALTGDAGDWTLNVLQTIHSYSSSPFLVCHQSDTINVGFPLQCCQCVSFIWQSMVTWCSFGTLLPIWRALPVVSLSCSSSLNFPEPRGSFVHMYDLSHDDYASWQGVTVLKTMKMKVTFKRFLFWCLRNLYSKVSCRHHLCHSRCRRQLHPLRGSRPPPIWVAAAAAAESATCQCLVSRPCWPVWLLR